MRRGLVVSLLVVLVVPASAQTDGGLTAALDAYVAAGVRDWEVPGLAIAVVKDGDLVFARGYGARELGAEGAVDEHTLFAIGSTTKAMTAATLAMLVDEEKVGWDDPVTQHLPSFQLSDPYVTREVKVRDLLIHRAGLGNADLLWYGTDLGREEILAKVPSIESAYSLRADFLYQNIMYLVAGRLAATVAGTSWEELVASRLFQPLGMDRTVPNLADTETMDNVARPHDRVDDEIVAIENEPVDSVAPAGSVWSSVSDMSRWLRLMLAEGAWGQNRLLSEAAVGELLSPQELLDLTAFYPAVTLIEPHWTTYGLGWFQLDYEGRAVSFHTGSIDGMAAIVGLVPDEDLGVVVLENLDHAELRHALLWKVIDLWGGQPDGRDWSAELEKLYAEQSAEAEAREQEVEQKRAADTRPSLPLESYAGAYSHPLYDRLEVTFEDGQLRYHAGPRRSGQLEHWHYDTFRARSDRRWQGSSLVTFSLDAAGQPSRFEMFGITYERVGEHP